MIEIYWIPFEMVRVREIRILNLSDSYNQSALSETGHYNMYINQFQPVSMGLQRYTMDQSDTTRRRLSEPLSTVQSPRQSAQQSTSQSTLQSAPQSTRWHCVPLCREQESYLQTTRGFIERTEPISIRIKTQWQ